ncbi:polysaccharide deacetylase family protein [Ideonella sp. DXS29W]|uniref:Polysaccharide deacetylase family protein n=1 Tax=Ideonella lacteola TaxID=2984193 RepID=A0ABU9BYI5_9BURK
MHRATKCLATLSFTLSLGAGAAQAGAADPANGECGPLALGTSRIMAMPREAAAYGRAQHPALGLQRGEVVLTFDDGPRPESTPLVLKALARHCARATFFMNGEPLLRAPDLARELVAQGHTAAMHGFVHHHFPQLSPERQLDDLRQMQQAYRQVFGTEPAAYRFPFLEETPPLREALAAARITVFSVDVGVEDWLPDQTPAMLTERLIKRLQETGGGIILLHDAQDQTAAALPSMLQALQHHGFKLVHLEWR